jgi:hypothetical protein
LPRLIPVKKRITFLVFLAAAGIFYQCKKDHSVLGNEVIPDSDRLSSDAGMNFPVFAHTVTYDSVYSINSVATIGDVKFLGSNRDPSFGKTDIGLCLNINIPGTAISIGAFTELVSAEIVLAVNNDRFIGQRAAPLTFSVFPLDSTLKADRSYFTSNDRLHNKNQLLARHTTAFTTYEGLPAVRIPIDPGYAGEILKNTAALSSNETLRSAYKGFYILPSCGDTEGIIYECDLSTSSSGFYLRCKNSAGKDTSFMFSFSGSGSARYNTVKFTPLPELQNQLEGDTALGANKLFLKGPGSTKLKVQIPFLKNYGDTFNVAVSRAEVIFYVDPEYASFVESKVGFKYPVPPRLALLPADSLGRELLETLDQKSSTYLSRYGGVYDVDNKRYVFNIPLHAQAILNGNRKNYGFYLVIADPAGINILRRDNFIEGVVLGGSNKGAKKPVLNLSYAHIKNN